jgi:hypothetical protein
MRTYGAFLLAASLAIAGCSRDPLVGEFSGHLTGKPVTRSDEVAKLRVSKESQQYRLSFWDERNRIWRAPLTLEACTLEEYKGFLGENWQELDPVGACSKNALLFHSRRGKTIAELTTTGYVLLIGLPFGGGGAFELEKH